MSLLPHASQGLAHAKEFSEMHPRDDVLLSYWSGKVGSLDYI